MTAISWHLRPIWKAHCLIIHLCRGMTVVADEAAMGVRNSSYGCLRLLTTCTYLEGASPTVTHLLLTEHGVSMNDDQDQMQVHEHYMMPICGAKEISRSHAERMQVVIGASSPWAGGPLRVEHVCATGS